MDKRQHPRRINVLILDGGGVRGLSALLILRELMLQINSSLGSKRGTGGLTVEPHHIFHLVAGTGTGGLIAIMLGKLGMNVEECIKSYHTLSRRIFRKKHIRGMITGGLASSKYSGKGFKRCFCNLLKERGYGEELPMKAGSNDKISCAVVCREHQSKSRISKIELKAVCICSLPCPYSLECLVSEAAQATSAAPTFFPVQEMNGRSFVDGGLEFNNPSHVIFDHYIKANRTSKPSRLVSTETETAVELACHNDFVFSQARLVNLGTGTDPEDPEVLGLASPIPGFIRMGMFLKRELKKRELKKVAVDSERTADYMRNIAETADDIEYVRFSADNGVCFVELDKFKDLGKIEQLTRDYLKKPRVQLKMQRLAEEIATDFLANERDAIDHLTSDLLDVPQRSIPRTQFPISHMRPPRSRASKTTGPSSDTQPSSATRPSSVSAPSTDQWENLSAKNIPKPNFSTAGSDTFEHDKTSSEIKSRYNNVTSVIRSALEQQASSKLCPQVAFALDDILLRLELWEDEVSSDEEQELGKGLGTVEFSNPALNRTLLEAFDILSQRIQTLLGWQEEHILPLQVGNYTTPFPDPELIGGLFDAFEIFNDLSEILRAQAEQSTISERIAHTLVSRIPPVIPS